MRDKEDLIAENISANFTIQEFLHRRQDRTVQDLDQLGNQLSTSVSSKGTESRETS